MSLTKRMFVCVCVLVCACNRKTSTMCRPKPLFGCCATIKEIKFYIWPVQFSVHEAGHAQYHSFSTKTSQLGFRYKLWKSCFMTAESIRDQGVPTGSTLRVDYTLSNTIMSFCLIPIVTLSSIFKILLIHYFTLLRST